VPTYAGVAYDDAWPGVDVAAYGTAGRFEYDLGLSPGADPGKIALRFDPPAKLASDGSLKIGGLTQPPRHAPGRSRDPERIRPAPRRNRRLQARPLRPHAAARDRSRARVLEVPRRRQRRRGAGDRRRCRGQRLRHRTDAVDELPRRGRPAQANGDAYVAKLAPDGHVVWTTFLGGGDFDEGHGIAVTADGVLVGGSTASLNFPAPRPIQGSRAGTATRS
jgi:hypothetical protein